MFHSSLSIKYYRLYVKIIIIVIALFGRYQDLKKKKKKDEGLMGKTCHECTDKMLYCRNEEVKRVIVEIYLVLWSRFEIVIICHKRIYNNWTTSLHL